MRYQPLHQDLYISNRKRLYSLLPHNSVIVVHANDIMPTNADGNLGFRQNSNLLSLTGIDQEESILLLAPNFPDHNLREVLFLRETSEEIAIWEGKKLNKVEAKQISGINQIRWLSEFYKVLHTVMAESDYLYLETNEHIRSVSIVQTSNDRFIQWCKEKYPLHSYRRLAPLMQLIRCIKQPQEIEAIKHACNITERAFREVLTLTKPGIWEYEIEAEYAFEFIRNKARFAYDPIIASGSNACVLHYTENIAQCQDGDLLLMDVGSAYANYASDMTRTIPVNGRFTKRQRAVYDAVLRVKNRATEMLVPGNTIPEYHSEVGKIMESELISLGLLSKTDIENQNPDWPAYKRYFMHGTSHHLGLDVHDVASVYKQFEEGMVLTVEPGIYIPEEGIGIRIEDNILITNRGPENLMKNIPIHAEEIEDLMNNK